MSYEVDDPLEEIRYWEDQSSPRSFAVIEKAPFRMPVAAPIYPAKVVMTNERLTPSPCELHLHGRVFAQVL